MASSYTGVSHVNTDALAILAADQGFRGRILGPVNPGGVQLAVPEQPFGGQFVNPGKRLLAESQGNVQALTDGNWLVGYGRLPNLTEFDPSGHVLLDATLGREVQSFKSLLFAWSGQPTSAPALVARRAGGGNVSLRAGDLGSGQALGRAARRRRHRRRRWPARPRCRWPARRRCLWRRPRSRPRRARRARRRR